MASDCPSPAALEAFALGTDSRPGTRSHVSRCEVCRDTVEEIQSNHRFLGRQATALVNAADEANNAVPRPAPSPDCVRGFTLIEEISRGGQGVVYRAVQISTKRPAAIKMLLGGAFASDRQRQRFEREIEIAARLRHPNIVSVFESGLATDGTPYVAMEYVEGVPLDRLPEHAQENSPRIDRVRVDDAMRLIGRVASGVGHAHTAGVIHRDLKPSNILVDIDGNPRVLDFGLARVADHTRGVQVSVTHEFVGTPAYASPEQLGGDAAQINARTDVYALGLILYRLLTGRHPYPCDGPLPELARHAIGTEPTPPSRYLPRIPSDAQTIVLKCLAKDPSRRYPNASALASDIEDYLNGRPISARRDSTAYVLFRLATRHRIPAIAGALVLLTVIFATVGLALLASDLSRSKRSAESALAESNIQRGRLLTAAGSLGEAERVLWGESEAVGLYAGVPDLGYGGTPLARQLTWALIELYAAEPRLWRTTFGDRPRRIGFSPDDLSFWCVGGRGAMSRWSLDGTLLESTPAWLDARRADVTWVSADGSRLVTSDERGLRLIDVRSRKVLAGPVPCLIDERGPACAFSPEGGLIAVRERGGRLYVVDGMTLRMIVELSDGVSSRLGGPIFSSDARFLAASFNESGSQGVRVWSTSDWSEQTGRLYEGPRVVSNMLVELRYMSAGADMMIASLAENILVWKRNEAREPIRHHLSSLRMVEADGGSTKLATASNDGATWLWSLPAIEPVRSLMLPGVVSVASFSSDAGKLAVGSRGDVISLYDVGPAGQPARVSIEAPGFMGAHGLSISPDGKRAVCGDSLGVIRIIDLASGRILRAVRAHTGVVTTTEYSPDGKWILSVGIAPDGKAADGRMCIWDAESGELLWTLADDLPPTWSARFTPDSTRIVAGDDSGFVHIFGDIGADPTVARVEIMHGRIPQVAVSPDGKKLAAANYDHTISICDVASGRVDRTLEGHQSPSRAVTFSPDGKWLATGSDDRTIRIWNTATWQVERVIDALTSDPFEIAFHPSGKVIFCIGRSTEVTAFDTATGVELAKLRGPERMLFGVRAKPDGSGIVTVGQDPWVSIWDLDSVRAAVRGNVP